jgi:hypothetical protein
METSHSKKPVGRKDESKKEKTIKQIYKQTIYERKSVL